MFCGAWTFHWGRKCFVRLTFSISKSHSLHFLASMNRCTPNEIKFHSYDNSIGYLESDTELTLMFVGFSLFTWSCAKLSCYNVYSHCWSVAIIIIECIFFGDFCEEIWRLLFLSVCKFHCFSDFFAAKMFLVQSVSLILI